MKKTKLKDKTKIKKTKKRQRLESSEGIDVSLRDLERALKIDKHALDEGLECQADLFYMVARECALLVSRQDSASQQQKEVEAAVDQGIRRQLDPNEKVTERDIEARRRTHPDVVEIVGQLLDLKRDVAIWQALKEAWQQRSYVLKELVTLYVASYYGDSTGRATDRVKGRDADTARRKMADARREKV